MKQSNDCTIRDKSLLKETAKLEHLFTFKDFPVFMGCVDTPQSEDIVADMIWDICKDTGIIQLRELLPLEILYLGQHNDGIGVIWHGLYKQFAEFIYQQSPGKHILEIGGANDAIAKYFLERDASVSWTIVEPHPDFVSDPRIRVVRSWFDEDFSIDEEVDTIIHSHVFEHTYDPVAFLTHINHFLKPGKRHIFTFPNMLPMLEHKFTNCLNFEHTAFLTEDIIEYLLTTIGFEIVAKEYYGDPHSILYSTIKRQAPSAPPSLPNHYKEYKKIFMEFISYHNNMVSDLNNKIHAEILPIYLFGAHIFSQYLIQFGLKTKKIVSILDNSPQKNGKRLYGTNLLVASPKILRDKGRVIVILKAGIYNEEIKKDILENINSEVEFW